VKIDAHIFRSLVVIACMVLVLTSSGAALAQPQGLLVEPRCLSITMSFRGGRVAVSAEIPRGAQAVVEFKGRDGVAELVRKGRRWGLWMGVGEITVANAPSLYLAMSTDSKLLSKQDPEARWGYGALREQVKFSGAIPEAGNPFLFEQFLKLKESEGLYGVFPGALKAVGTDGDVMTVEGHFRLPGNIKPDTYHVSLCVLNNGKIVERRSIEFPVEMKLVAAFLVSLAHRHATLYGVLAVFIAMVTGFLMGHVFKGKRAH
jgi:hypothetical protein